MKSEELISSARSFGACGPQGRRATAGAGRPQEAMAHLVARRGSVPVSIKFKAEVVGHEQGHALHPAHTVKNTKESWGEPVGQTPTLKAKRIHPQDEQGLEVLKR